MFSFNSLQPEISRGIVPTPEGCSESSDGHNHDKVTFNRTSVMSTYLVAMVLGDFEYISAKIPSDDMSSVCSSAISGTEESKKALTRQLEIRVYTPFGKRDFGQYALTVAKKSLLFYAECLDLLTHCRSWIWLRFWILLMVQWRIGSRGALFILPFAHVCRETVLLLDPANSSPPSKRYVALTVANEVSHMWFGNLVTMSWWTDLRLNEGFAMWAGSLAVDHLFPDCDICVTCPSYRNLWRLKWDSVEFGLCILALNNALTLPLTSLVAIIPSEKFCPAYLHKVRGMGCDMLRPGFHQLCSSSKYLLLVLHLCQAAERL
ncbi:unnamed protein product [Taenia asiatica]|uniref:Peptidase M1 membrane alanine aminopeptidase domain-containing protein n=1 Tax=Taenia asiatica TaxID=60517 RepID=A0A3P6Q4R6_TAEAS|nr:unnamed protein product [Taenia asiatica]